MHGLELIKTSLVPIFESLIFAVEILIYRHIVKRYENMPECQWLDHGEWMEIKYCMTKIKYYIFHIISGELCNLKWPPQYEW